MRKEYTYRIYNSRLGNPFFVDRAWFYPKHLDEAVMQRAADQFVGTHDFRAVRSVGTETRTTVRTVYYFDVSRTGDLIECRVCANGFLYDHGLAHGVSSQDALKVHVARAIVLTMAQIAVIALLLSSG